MVAESGRLSKKARNYSWRCPSLCQHHKLLRQFSLVFQRISLKRVKNVTRSARNQIYLELLDKGSPLRPSNYDALEPM
jgi:hypothetical protein